MFGYFLTGPASSPDLNHIEQIWRTMKHRIYRRSPHPTTNPSLHITIQEGYDVITQDVITALTSSLPARKAAVRNGQEDYTTY